MPKAPMRLRPQPNLSDDETGPTWPFAPCSTVIGYMKLGIIVDDRIEMAQCFHEQLLCREPGPTYWNI
jgi:hypothetical protein